MTAKFEKIKEELENVCNRYRVYLHTTLNGDIQVTNQEEKSIGNFSLDHLLKDDTE